MINIIKNIIICKVKNHKIVSAGSCPFTGNTYNACERCGKMFIVDKAQE
jgi:hypothetical protein